MPIPPKSADELLRLLSRHWDCPLTPDEMRRVEELVHQHGDAAVDLLFRFSELHVDLEAIMASSQSCERALESINRLDRVQPKGKLSVRRRSQRMAPRRGKRRSSAVGFAAAAAAVLLLGVGVFLRSQSSDRGEVGRPSQQPELYRPPITVACVAGLTDAIWSRSTPLTVGQALMENERLELVEGGAQLSMACGADIALKAPCAVTLAADDFVYLERGELTVEVAKWATGFVVDTKGLRVTDLGTKFAVTSADSGVAEAHVLEGEILAEPMKAFRPRRTSMLLAAGEAIRVDLPQATIDQIAAETDRFVQRLKQFRPLRPIQINNSGVGVAVGGDDPHWRITAGPSTHGSYPRQANVTRGDPSYLDNKPDASQWISVGEEIYPFVPASSVHTFETSFNLTGYDLSTVRVIGSFLVDDAINELRINGKPVPFKRWQTTWDVYDFKSFHTIEIRDGFVHGKNVISIDVFNSPSHPSDPDHPNPMGIRVEWQAFGCEQDQLPGTAYLESALKLAADTWLSPKKFVDFVKNARYDLGVGVIDR
jgi:ferric-dicitrate binding protein FerR (iron transport regulator)